MILGGALMTPSLTTAAFIAAALFFSACGFVGLDELPMSDAGTEDAAPSDAPALDASRDSGTIDASASDVGTIDAGGSDAGGSDAGSVDAGRDAGAGTDAGACSPPRWGVNDDDTSDVAGDDFGRQTWTVRLCRVPALGEQLTLIFRARITAPGTMYDYDLFATYMWINGVGGPSGGIDRTWAPERVEGETFRDYTLLLPADIDDDGIVDWTLGDNDLELRTWSNYNDRLSKTGIDSLLLMWP